MLDAQKKAHFIDFGDSEELSSEYPHQKSLGFANEREMTYQVVWELICIVLTAHAHRTSHYVQHPNVSKEVFDEVMSWFGLAKGGENYDKKFERTARKFTNRYGKQSRELFMNA